MDLEGKSKKELTKLTKTIINFIISELNKSRSTIAQEVGFSSSYLSALMNNQKQPSAWSKIKFINKLSRIYDVVYQEEGKGFSIKIDKEARSAFILKYLFFLHDSNSEVISHYRFAIDLITSEVVVQEDKNERTNTVYEGRFHLTSENTVFRLYPADELYNANFLLNAITNSRISKGIKEEILFGVFNHINKKQNLISGEFILIDSEIDVKPYLDKIIFFFKNREVQSELKSPKSFLDFCNQLDEYSSANRTVKIKVPPELTTAYQQFLSFFSDYVEIAKGKNIRFDVLKDKDTLEIKVKSLDSSIDIIQIGTYLNEYLSFAKENLENLKVPIETDLSENEFNILLLDLKGQVNHLKHSLEIASLKNKLLEGEISHLRQLSMKFADKENIIHTQIIQGGEQQFADKIKNI